MKLTIVKARALRDRKLEYRGCLRAERLRYPAIQRSGIHSARLPRDLRAVTKENQCGDAPDAITSAELRILIRVHFRHL